MSDLPRIEPATVAHNAVLVQLHAQCFDDAWSAQAMSEVLMSPGAFATVVMIADQPAGFSLARMVSTDEAELLTICVLPAMRRRKLGAALLADVLRRAASAGAKRLFLEVAENNEPARSLYGAYGFTAVGRRPDYYRLPNRVPIAALTLRVDLHQ